MALVPSPALVTVAVLARLGGCPSGRAARGSAKRRAAKPIVPVAARRAARIEIERRLLALLDRRHLFALPLPARPASRAASSL